MCVKQWELQIIDTHSRLKHDNEPTFYKKRINNWYVKLKKYWKKVRENAPIWWQYREECQVEMDTKPRQHCLIELAREEASLSRWAPRERTGLVAGGSRLAAGGWRLAAAQHIHFVAYRSVTPTAGVNRLNQITCQKRRLSWKPRNFTLSIEIRFRNA